MKGEPPRDLLSLRFESDPRLLCVARSAVRRYARLAGFSERRAEEIVLAVDESLTNVIRHCYEGLGGEPIELELLIEGEGPAEMVVRIRDDGPPVSPDCLRPAAEKDPEQPGGLGLRLIHEVMDRVELRPMDRGRGNVLILRASCPSDSGPEP